MKKIVLSSVVSIGLVLGFSGCEAVKGFNNLMGIPNSPQEYIAKNSDKELATAFSKYWESSSITKNYIEIKENHFSFDDYIKQYELESKVAQRFDQSKYIQLYKETIKKRGNIFKVYKNALNKEIFRIAHNVKTLKTSDEYSYYRYDWTPCIIEYNKNGQIVSALTQANEIWVAYNHFGNSSAPSKSISTIKIFTGFTASSLQNKISNRLFENNFLYQSK